VKVSVIVPVLNEAPRIRATLEALQPLRKGGHEVIVVDGGSDDGTAALARTLCDRVLCSAQGRARQMNAGANVARGDILWFLHADTLVSPAALVALQDELERSTRDWGRFDVSLTGAHPLLRLVEWSMNLRSHLTAIATGDQGIFVRGELFEQVGGFADIPLMEDIALSRRLKRHGPPLRLRARLHTSSRRWESNGIVRTILLMWRLRFAYWRGVTPQRLAERYRRG